MKVCALDVSQCLRVLSARGPGPYACEVSSPQRSSSHWVLGVTRGSPVPQIMEQAVSGTGAFHEGLR